MRPQQGHRPRPKKTSESLRMRGHKNSDTNADPDQRKI